MGARRTLLLTPRGAVAALLTGALAAGAWAGGILEFAVVGGALAAGLLGAVTLVLVRSAGFRRAAPALLLPPGEVVAGSAVSVGVVVRGVAGWVGDLCVDDPSSRWGFDETVGHGPARRGLARRGLARRWLARLPARSLAPLGHHGDRSSWSAMFAFPTVARGPVRLPPLGLWCTDPLRLVVRQVGRTPAVHRLVVPRPATVTFPGHLGSTGGGDAHDLEGLRPYVPGDRLTHVHWPTLARGGVPLVRHFVTEGADRLRLLLDLGDPAAEEQVVEVAAGLGVAAARQGAGVDVWTTGGEHWSVPPGPGAPSALLRALATAGRGSSRGVAGRTRPPAGAVAITTPARCDRLARSAGTVRTVLVGTPSSPAATSPAAGGAP